MNIGIIDKIDSLEHSVIFELWKSSCREGWKWKQ